MQRSRVFVFRPGWFIVRLLRIWITYDILIRRMVDMTHRDRQRPIMQRYFHLEFAPTIKSLHPSAIPLVLSDHVCLQLRLLLRGILATLVSVGEGFHNRASLPESKPSFLPNNIVQLSHGIIYRLVVHRRPRLRGRIALQLNDGAEMDRKLVQVKTICGIQGFSLILRPYMISAQVGINRAIAIIVKRRMV
jgi:hypothetical protein